MSRGAGVPALMVPSDLFKCEAISFIESSDILIAQLKDTVLSTWQLTRGFTDNLLEFLRVQGFHKAMGTSAVFEVHRPCLEAILQMREQFPDSVYEGHQYCN